jgi:Na+-transporting NADH:ubiquinone oxidoreductase subunit NqrA
MRIEVGAEVAVGQPLFADRRHPEIVFAAPGEQYLARTPTNDAA